MESLQKEEKDFVKVLVVVSREIMVVVEWGAGCHSSVPDGQAVSSQGVGVRGGGRPGAVREPGR